MATPAPPPGPPAPEGFADPRDAIFDVSDLAAGAGRRAGQAGIVLVLFSALKFLLNLGGIAILARLIPPEEFGVVALALPMVGLITNVSGMGLGTAVVQREHVTHRLANALFWINAGLALVAGLILMALGPVAATYFDEPRVAPVFLVLGVMAMVGPLSMQFAAVMRRRMRITQMENIGIVASTVALAAAVLAALAGLSYWAIIVQSAVTTLVSLAAFSILSGWRPSAPWEGDWAGARGALKFGGGLTVYNFTARVVHNVSTLMVGRIFDPATAGLYFRAQRIAEILPTRFVSPLSNAFMPTLARLHGDGPAFNAMFARMVTRTNVAMMPVAITTAVAAEPMVRILMGETWLESAPILAILSVLILQASLSRGINWVLVASGRTGWMMIFGLVVATVSFAALFWGAQYGLVVMVTAHMAVMLLVRMPLLLILALRVSPLRAAALRAPLMDWALAVCAVAVLIALREALPEMVALAELAVLSGAAAAIWGVRVLCDASMRADIGTALGMVLGRLRPRRPATGRA